MGYEHFGGSLTSPRFIHDQTISYISMAFSQVKYIRHVTFSKNNETISPKYFRMNVFENRSITIQYFDFHENVRKHISVLKIVLVSNYFGSK